LFRRPGQVTLRRLGFEPELSVNGCVVDFVSLADGDRIRTGPFEFRVHITRCRGTEPEPKRLALDGPADYLSAATEVDRLLAEVRSAFPAAGRLTQRLAWPVLSADRSRAG
jgi:predicted component of type VI protein secretion system